MSYRCDPSCLPGASIWFGSSASFRVLTNLSQSPSPSGRASMDWMPRR